MAVLLPDGVDIAAAAASTGMSGDLFEILVCPADKHDLRLNVLLLECPDCGRRYSIVGGIPNMLVEDSQPGNSA